MCATLTKVERIAIGETFKQMEVVIHNLCQEAQRRFGMDYDDLFSRASELFIIHYKTHRPTKGDFDSWIYHKIRFGLIDHGRVHLRRSKKRESGDVNLELVPESHRWDWLSELSTEHQLVVALVLRMDRPTMEKLRRILYQLHWDDEDISECIQAIRKGLSTICNDQ